MTQTPEALWHWWRLDDMTPLQLYELLALREAVFVVEQQCVYRDLDGLDVGAWHLLGKDGQHDQTTQAPLVACLRVLPPTDDEPAWRIGRVAVTPDWRGRGVARSMLQQALRHIEKHGSLSRVALNAQSYLEDFYRSVGFVTCGEEFVEDGVPHVPMQLSSASAAR